MIYNTSCNRRIKLVVKRESNVNTFVEVDMNDNPIIKKRSWSCIPQEQHFVISGFEKLTSC